MAAATKTLVLLLLAGSMGCSAETRETPVIVPSYYTTSDAVITTETVFIVEFSLTWRNGRQNIPLYADVGGKQFPVTWGQDMERYQASWSVEHRHAHSGTYEVRFFDEESYSLLRKAQRNSEDVSAIRPCLLLTSSTWVPGTGLGSPQRCWPP